MKKDGYVMNDDDKFAINWATTLKNNLCTADAPAGPSVLKREAVFVQSQNFEERNGEPMLGE